METQANSTWYSPHSPRLPNDSELPKLCITLIGPLIPSSRLSPVLAVRPPPSTWPASYAPPSILVFIASEPQGPFFITADVPEQEVAKLGRASPTAPPSPTCLRGELRAALPCLLPSRMRGPVRFFSLARRGLAPLLYSAGEAPTWFLFPTSEPPAPLLFSTYEAPKILRAPVRVGAPHGLGGAPRALPPPGRAWLLHAPPAPSRERLLHAPLAPSGTECCQFWRIRRHGEDEQREEKTVRMSTDMETTVVNSKMKV